MAARLSRGIELAEFGPSLEWPLIELPADRPVVEGDEIRGHIVRTDSFGNLITNIDASLIPEAVGDQVAVEFGMQRIDGISRFYGEKDAGDLLALFGSSGRLEIAIWRPRRPSAVGLVRGRRRGARETV